MNHLLSATILLLAVWPIYYLLIRYSDRYALNRLLLLLAMVAVVALPFIEYSSPAPVVTQSIQGTITYLEEGVITGGGSIDPEPKEIRYDQYGEEILIANPTIITFNLLPKVYMLGLGLLALVLGFRLLFILGLHLRSRPNEDGQYRLMPPSAKPGQAFTFGRNLYFSHDVPNDPDFEHVLNHERVHARQFHSLDILLSEIFLCIFWFHPAAWWLRISMRANLEYLVDKAVISNGADRRDYQLALVRQSQGAYGLALALPFSEPSLKSRIVRMTGMPEYRLVALVATVALVFWLGASLLLINGKSMADAPQGEEYLAAVASPGDPYYDYFQNNLPEELTSLEIFTSRMVTVDEYLQLRAILSKVPGAKLFVYKNAFDEGYSLELRWKNQEPAIVTGLGAAPLTRDISILSLMRNGGPGQYTPFSATWKTDQAGDEGALRGFHVNQRKDLSLDKMIVREGLLRAGIGEELLVFVNEELISLVESANVKVNGVEASTLGVDSWPEVLVEGRVLMSPKQRMEQVLEVKAGAIKAFSLVSSGPCDCTYRDWYEKLGFLKDQPLLAFYNDRPVTPDFLLDTEFGNNAMIQHGAIYDTPMGRYALQVFDDYPDVEAVRNNRVFKIDLSGDQREGNEGVLIETIE